MASQSEPNSSQGASQRRCRLARPLPFELRQHCNVYFQEGLHSQALALVLNLLISGTDVNSNGQTLPAFVPTPQILALAATLVVHPAHTTRLPATERIQAADEALFYLEHINQLVGARNAGLDEAFRFGDPTPTRGARRRDRLSDRDSPDDDREDDKVSIGLTNEDSLWSRAETFWDVVGWSFNCSVVHPNRWERWRLWLSFMLDVLSDDLGTRTAEARALRLTNKRDEAQVLLDDALLSRYLSVLGDGRSAKRRLMRAILADGSKNSLNEFGEIWKNETKERKEIDENRTTRQKLDFEKDEFADYMDVDDEDDETDTSNALRSSTRASTRRGRTASAQSSDDDDDSQAEGSKSNDSDALGGHDSILFRQRILALLTDYCGVNKRGLMDTEDLFDIYTEFLRPLPLITFTAFAMPSSPYLDPHAQASLNQMLLRPLISSEAPVYNENDVTQEDLEKHFLPFAANLSSMVNNAKVSILVESLMRLLWRHKQLSYTAGLRNGTNKGIQARIEKAGFDGRRKTKEALEHEYEARLTMEQSAARMTALLDALQNL